MDGREQWIIISAAMRDISLIADLPREPLALYEYAPDAWHAELTTGIYCTYVPAVDMFMVMSGERMDQLGLFDDCDYDDFDECRYRYMDPHDEIPEEYYADNVHGIVEIWRSELQMLSDVVLDKYKNMPKDQLQEVIDDALDRKDFEFLESISESIRDNYNMKK